MKNLSVQRLIQLFFTLTDSKLKKIVFAAIVALIFYGLKKGMSRYKVKTNLIVEDGFVKEKVVISNSGQSQCKWEILQEVKETNSSGLSKAIGKRNSLSWKSFNFASSKNYSLYSSI